LDKKIIKERLREIEFWISGRQSSSELFSGDLFSCEHEEALSETRVLLINLIEAEEKKEMAQND